MKIILSMLAAVLALSACVFVPENRNGDGHERDHSRDHCDHDGHCDQRHD